MSILQTIAVVGAALTPGAGEYAWPLSLDPQLTSSFAEYRSGRFHAGIDLRTAGVGREVFAAGDGYVSRVRSSPYGYGKAVYLQLADGNVAVYAHLDDYYPELRDYVQREQHRKENYTVDVQLKPSQFPVRKGQLIAYSGQTGIGAPHLHFEMRDAAHRPINPRLLGFDWPDSTAPRIDKILVAPKGVEGRVNGDVRPVALDVVRDEQGYYRTTPVRASGLIGFGADVTDPGSGGYNLGVHQLRIITKGTERFRMQHDRMSYTNHRNGAVSYHPHMMGKGRFLVLWRWPGNRCDSYQFSHEDGWIAVGPEREDYVVEAVDFYGNSVSVVVPVVPESGNTGGEAAPAGAAPSIELDVWGPELLVAVDAAAATPVLQINGSPAPAFADLGGARYRAAFRPGQSEVYALSVLLDGASLYTRDVAVFVQGQPRKTLDVEGVQISAGPDSPYGALFLRIWKEDQPPAHPMPGRSAAYYVWPGDVPIFDPITISIPLDPGVAPARNIHLYRHRGAYWSREDSVHRNGRIEVETRNPGLYMAMEDTVQPSFSNVSPPQDYRAETRRPVIRANVSDNGSGVSDYRITCGGKWLLTAYDPERNQIFWERDEDLPSGRQSLAFTITDEAGNTRTYTRDITVPE